MAMFVNGGHWLSSTDNALFDAPPRNTPEHIRGMHFNMRVITRPSEIDIVLSFLPMGTASDTFSAFRVAYQHYFG